MSLKPQPNEQDAQSVQREAWDRERTLLDSSPLSSVDNQGRPIPVTIPIALVPGVRVAYTTRLGGVSSGDYAQLNLGGKGGDDPQAVAANRQALGRQLNRPVILVDQVHSAQVWDADQGQPQGRCEADAQVTTRRDLALGIFAADCLPVLLADPQAGVMGAAHCGRRGLVAGVISATVQAMVDKGANPSRIVATLGPRICADCYQVGSDLADDFEKRFPGASGPCRFGGTAIDIAAAARMELKAAGVTNIADSAPRVGAATSYLRQDPDLEELCSQDSEGPSLLKRLEDLRRPLCTLENPLWYSHRRASLSNKVGEGRMLALILADN
ncbi:laccase domain-containing protein [Bifidobacterium sp. B4001]|uniref:polyphenol oxidase family protein n=1 Tax=unclassified Bifidobacterium TaxID=2608897 RepID=UPI00226B8C6D|nr:MULTISPECIES: polyphenol oxidase family protein [unclassified Bifidobacterium]MCX8673069.1 laccase domain-containing protein [Bifidobacterium sp. B4079]MCX8681502.1 laccase domain-containing protein [Bifidobacterium sp. B4001]